MSTERHDTDSGSDAALHQALDAALDAARGLADHHQVTTVDEAPTTAAGKAAQLERLVHGIDIARNTHEPAAW